MTKYSIILFSLMNLFFLKLFSAEIDIVEVRRNVPLSDEDAVYKDFYINAGEGSGLKKNLVVNVKRKIYLKDAAAKPLGDIETTVGQIKIIHVDSKTSVAREYKLLSRDEEPMLEQVGLMTGDRLELQGSFIDNTKPAAKKKIADASENSSQVNPVERKPSQSQEPLNIKLIPEI